MSCISVLSKADRLLLEFLLQPARPASVSRLQLFESFSQLPDRLLLKLLLHAEAVIENALADSQMLRCDLKQLILSQIFEAVFQRHILRRDQAERIIAAACTGIGQMLSLADIDNNILGFRRTADDHALIDLGACRNEQTAALLRVIEAVCDRLACLIGDQRTDCRNDILCQ